MTDLEYSLLSPRAKWTIFNRFPTKLCLHLVLLLLTTSQLFIFNFEDSRFTRTMKQTWGYFFMPKSSQYPQTLYGLTETLNSMQSLSDNFFSLQRRSVQAVGYLDASTRVCYFTSYSDSDSDSDSDSRNSPLPPKVTLHSRSQNKITYDSLTPGPISDTIPYFKNRDTFANFSLTMDSISYTMALCNVNTGYFFKSCYQWSVVVDYDFSNRANLLVSTTDTISGTCDNEYELKKYLTKMSHNLGVLAASTLYLALLVKEFLRKLSTFKQVKIAHDRAHTYWKIACADGRASKMSEFFSRGKDGYAAQLAVEIPFDKMPIGIKLKFFPMWLLFNAASVFSAAIFSIYVISNRSFYIATRREEKLAAGLTCLCLWTGIIKYFQHHRRYYSIILTLKHALPSLLPFIVGVFPIFIGYALFAVSYFGNTSSSFIYPTDSFRQLFSVLNGDVIYLTFTSLWKSNVFVANFYLYSFIIVFIYLVLNVIIALVEHSYFLSQGKKRTFELFMDTGFQQNNINDGSGGEEQNDDRDGDRNTNNNTIPVSSELFNPSNYLKRRNSLGGSKSPRKNSGGNGNPRKFSGGLRGAGENLPPPSSPIKNAYSSTTQREEFNKTKSVSNLLSFADEVALLEILLEEAKLVNNA